MAIRPPPPTQRVARGRPQEGFSNPRLKLQATDDPASRSCVAHSVQRFGSPYNAASTPAPLADRWRRPPPAPMRVGSELRAKRATETCWHQSGSR